MPNLMATTDADGRFEIHGAKKINEYELSVKRDPATGMIGRTVKLRDTPAYEPIVADIGVGKGIVLTGRLLDDQTGDPVSGGYVCVGVLSDNEFGEDSPGVRLARLLRLRGREGGRGRTARSSRRARCCSWPASDRPGSAKGRRSRQYQQLRTDPDYPQYFDKELSGFRSPGGVTTIIQGQWCKVLKLKPDETELTFDIRFKRASRFTVKCRTRTASP